MVEITQIVPDSIASTLDIRIGDKILSINDKLVNDQIDYRYLAADEKIEILIQRDNNQTVYEIEKEFNEDIGLGLEPMKMKACGNNCVFCFVYQNPRGMRRTLYFKDEDYRFSFLYGHYVTLTRVTPVELQRIVDQQLSPLYISVHATEEKTRKLLLGINRDDQLLEKISFLIRGNIELHAQIVLCPGYNDGNVFDKTIADLKQFYPGVRSVAVVPVGLTRHREHLFKLRLHTTEELQDMITYTNNMRQQLSEELGDSFVYLSDEFFIKAQQSLPKTDYYDAFYQIENGVGEFRDMINRFDSELKLIPRNLEQKITVTWVTGTLAFETLEKYIISELNKIKNLTINLVPITNEFYGRSIEVSGLLVGQDIYNQLKDRKLGDMVFLPPRVLNQDNLLLDDWSVDQLKNALAVPVHVYKESIGQIVSVINTLREHE